MNPRRSVLLLTALCSLGALPGCATGSGEPEDTTKFTIENTDQFSALDPDTEAAVKCTGLQERLLGDGRLEVVANVKNRGNQPVTVEIRCVFLNDQVILVGPVGHWQTLALAADATEVVRFTASDVAAKRYAIQVRKAP
jgi:hypothetical protein